MPTTHTRPRRFHSLVIREPSTGRYTVIYDAPFGGRRTEQIAGFRTRDEALDARASLRRMAAGMGHFVHAEGCCA